MKLRHFAQALSLLALTGCYYDNGRHHHDCMDGDCTSNTQPKDVPQSNIDTGATLAEIQPGQGAGAFVEYAGDGRWHVFTACDTDISHYACRWDIIVSVPSGSVMKSFEGESLEPDDSLDLWDAQSVRLVTDTTSDFDGFFFEATPGSTARVDVYLDDGPAPRYIYWVGDGGLHQGAPSNPIDLKPTSP